MIAIDLSKQQAIDPDPKAIPQVSFTVNPDREGNKAMLFIVEESKKTILDSPQRTVKVLWLLS